MTVGNYYSKLLAIAAQALSIRLDKKNANFESLIHYFLVFQ